jgi:predicted O-methyltransferase YrrM
MSTLRSDAVRTVLDRIYAASEAHDASALQRFRVRREGRGQRLPASEAAEVYRDAPLAVGRRIGELLYVLVLNRSAARIVEFGTSFGASTIYLAAAIRDAGAGHLVTTELDTEKAQNARRNLADAGLADVVELRVGNALETLRDLTDSIDFIFLDGFGNFYLPVLRLLEPHLRLGALVVADPSAGSPYWPDYESYVRTPANGYFSINVPLDHGVEVSVRTVPT